MTEGAFPGRTNTVPIAEELEALDDDVAPPAYGDHHDQLQFSQAGFAAGAAVTADGRVHININEKNRRLSELLAPSLDRQLRTEAHLPAGPLPPAYIPPSLGGLPGQLPPPRLNVVIQIVGSRGDVQPFVALGQVLRDTYGHRVRLATHANFRSFVEENGLEFFNIGGDPAKLMAFMVKNPGLMPGLDALKSGEIKMRRQEIHEILMGCWRSCIDAGDGMGVPPVNTSSRPFVADAIIANPPSFAHIHIAEKLGIPLHMMFTMPWTPTRAFPHPLADIVSANTDVAMTNYVSYALVEMMTWQGLGDMINRFRTNVLELEPISLLWAPGLLARLRVPTTYCWSPALTPKPADWAPEITVSGFYFLDLESNYAPPPDLAWFLQAGPPPVYIGFGSIVVDDPDALTRAVFGAVIKAGVRAVVSKGWGDIGGDAANVPEGVFMLGNCPHDWLFKHVSAVVHHGGAGTTAAGIKAGKPTVIVPFFGDQIFWGSMIARSGAGPAPIPYKKLTAESLAAAICEALRPETTARARELGEKIQLEKGADVGGKSFHQFLNTDNLRCSLAPSRVAVWRVRRSKIRLSALAAAVLVKEGLLRYSDLKLYRPIEYNTEEQPWDPISAVALALAGDIGALTMALADFPREVFKSKKENAGADPSSSHSRTPSASIPFQPTSHGSVESLVSSSLSAFSLPTTSNLIPQPTNSSTAPTVPRRQTPSVSGRGGEGDPSDPPPASTATNVAANIDLAVASGKSVARIVEAAAKFPPNFCLGLARGFRNAPRLYNDDTVRPTEKVTGFLSGVKVAGKEFGLGMYDGVAGLVTQPLRGAEKEGGKGLLKGVGKGIGGLIFKPAAAVWSLPAYTMQGVMVEVGNALVERGRGMRGVVESRVRQGEEDWAGATAGERGDIVARWVEKKEELKGFYLLKQREVEMKGEPGAWSRREAGSADGNGAGGRKSRKKSWRRGPQLLDVSPPTTATAVRPASAGTVPPGTAHSSSSASSISFEDDEALELAIRQSVEQTSTGDREEDARIEAAVRASVMEMRRLAELQQWRQHQDLPRQGAQGPAKGDQKMALSGRDGDKAHWEGETGDADEWRNITDEEYQALIEEAVRQSLLQHQMEQARWELDGQQQQHYHERPSGSNNGNHGEKVGRGVPSQQPPAGVYELPGDYPTTTAADATPAGQRDGRTRNFSSEETEQEDEDEQLRRAMEESEREQKDRVAQAERQRTEEEIVLEYVKRQSLAEEEYRRARERDRARARELGKGKGVASGGGMGDEVGEGHGGGDEDEELKRALEESLRMSAGGGGGGGPEAGPSRSR
ncbi:hypothetical protein VTK26DRAFT_1585 [Humicola hyalothermophila]